MKNDVAIYQTFLGDQIFLNKMANWALWRAIFGYMWTEYTLYYLTARCTGTFDYYHFHRSNSSSAPPLNLYGPSVWWRTDWTSFLRYQLLEAAHTGIQRRQKEFDNGDGKPIVDTSPKPNNLFTVLQSHTPINQTLFHALLYPVFINHLIHRQYAQQVVNILNQMVKQFVENRTL